MTDPPQPFLLITRSVEGLVTQVSTDQGVPGRQSVQGEDGPRAAGSLCGTRFTHSEKRAASCTGTQNISNVEFDRKASLRV